MQARFHAPNVRAAFCYISCCQIHFEIHGSAVCTPNSLFSVGTFYTWFKRNGGFSFLTNGVLHVFFNPNERVDSHLLSILNKSSPRKS